MVIVCADVAVIEHKTSKKYYQRVVPCSFIAMESLDFWEDDLADGDYDEMFEGGVKL